MQAQWLYLSITLRTVANGSLGFRCALIASPHTRGFSHQSLTTGREFLLSCHCTANIFTLGRNVQERHAAVALIPGFKLFYIQASENSLQLRLGKVKLEIK